MNETGIIYTWDVLRDLGFQLDGKVISDGGSGLSFDFGNFKLSASLFINRWFVEIVLFTGILRTQRTLAEVSFEMPREVESRELCAAWIIYYLDRAGEKGVFVPTKEVPWLADGRQYKHLLPWERKREAYNARPRCTIQREWMKLALKNLSEILSGVTDDEPVFFYFDGRALTVMCAGKTVLVAAEGSAWPAIYQLVAGRMKRLPKRLMNPGVEVSVWQSSLLIGNYRYEVIAEAPKG